MTRRVRLTGWLPGLKKVSLAKLIRELAGLPLDQAHDAVNRLLGGDVVDLSFASSDVAGRFAEEARELGAVAECVDMIAPANP
jgi:hypothetical protein